VRFSARREYGGFFRRRGHRLSVMTSAPPRGRDDNVVIGRIAGRDDHQLPVGLGIVASSCLYSRRLDSDDVRDFSAAQRIDFVAKGDPAPAKSRQPAREGGPSPPHGGAAMASADPALNARRFSGRHCRGLRLPSVFRKSVVTFPVHHATTKISVLRRKALSKKLLKRSTTVLKTSVSRPLPPVIARKYLDFCGPRK